MISGYRNITNDDYLIMREFLYQAIYIPPEEPKPDKSIIDLPEIAKYIDNWNHSKDFGIIGYYNDNVIGIIWGRLFEEDNHGYGFVDKSIPEMSMAMDFPYRNKGFGTEMLQLFVKLAKEKKHNRLSLSVDKRNRAYNFYRKNGFRTVKETDLDYIMTIDL
jgi:GNAT superfamily N-acetyltransferase